MENPLPFLSGGLPDRAHGVRSIILTRSDGTTLALDPIANRPAFHEEQPNVERMADDWGAICEVYKNAGEVYLDVPGVILQAGDRLTLAYGAKPALHVQVAEIVAGRARVTLSG